MLVLQVSAGSECSVMLAAEREAVVTNAVKGLKATLTQEHSFYQTLYVSCNAAFGCFPVQSCCSLFWIRSSVLKLFSVVLRLKDGLSSCQCPMFISCQ